MRVLCLVAGLSLALCLETASLHPVASPKNQSVKQIADALEALLEERSTSGSGIDSAVHLDIHNAVLAGGTRATKWIRRGPTWKPSGRPSSGLTYLAIPSAMNAAIHLMDWSETRRPLPLNPWYKSDSRVWKTDTDIDSRVREIIDEAFRASFAVVSQLDILERGGGHSGSVYLYLEGRSVSDADSAVKKIIDEAAREAQIVSEQIDSLEMALWTDAFKGDGSQFSRRSTRLAVLRYKRLNDLDPAVQKIINEATLAANDLEQKITDLEARLFNGDWWMRLASRHEEQERIDRRARFRERARTRT